MRKLHSKFPVVFLQRSFTGKDKLNTIGIARQAGRFHQNILPLFFRESSYHQDHQTILQLCRFLRLYITKMRIDTI